MATVFSRLKQFMFSYSWEIVEIEGAAFKLAWAIWLLLPFQAFRSISGYASVATENIWGVGLLILGAIHLYSVVKHKRRLRQVMTFIAFLFWLFTVVLIWFQSHTAALIPLFAVIALFMFINFLRLSIPVGQVDQRVVNLGRAGGLPDRRSHGAN
jgi:hypothetical protein